MHRSITTQILGSYYKILDNVWSLSQVFCTGHLCSITEWQLRLLLYFVDDLLLDQGVARKLEYAYTYSRCMIWGCLFLQYCGGVVLGSYDLVLWSSSTWTVFAPNNGRSVREWFHGICCRTGAITKQRGCVCWSKCDKYLSRYFHFYIVPWLVDFVYTMTYSLTRAFILTFCLTNMCCWSY